MSENTNTNTENKRKSSGGCWVKTTKNGDKFLSLQVEVNGEKYDYVGFKNDYRQEGSNQPHYKLFVANVQRAATQESPAVKKPVPAKATKPQETEEFI